MKMPDDQTIALINQLQLRVIDLEIVVSRRDQPHAPTLSPLYCEASLRIRDRALAQMQYETKCQKPSEEKSA